MPEPITNPNGFSWNVTVNFSTYVKKWVNNSNPDNYEYNGKRVDLVYGDAFVRTPDGKMVIDPGSGVYTCAFLIWVFLHKKYMVMRIPIGNGAL